MKRYLIIFTAVFILAGATYSLSSAEIVNGIACKVGGEIITINEFEAAYEQVQQQASLFGGAPPTKREVMGGLIDRVFLKREAKRKGIVVSGDELNSIVDNIKKQNKINDEQLQRELEKEKLTLEMLKDRYRFEIITSRLINQLIAERGVQIPDEEIEEFYEDPNNRRLITMPGIVKLWEIFIPAGDDMTFSESMDLKKKAVDLYERAKGGEDFEALLAESSESEGNRKTGGFIGSFTREQLLGTIAPDNVDAIFSLDSGEFTYPIRFNDGYRLFKIEERTENKRLTLEQSYDNIKSYLLKKRGDEIFKKWLIEIKEATTVQYMIDMG